VLRSGPFYRIALAGLLTALSLSASPGLSARRFDLDDDRISSDRELLEAFARDDG
jgi:hypothetical protein